MAHKTSSTKGKKKHPRGASTKHKQAQYNRHKKTREVKVAHGGTGRAAQDRINASFRRTEQSPETAQAIAKKLGLEV